jgi:hypothetical protein
VTSHAFISRIEEDARIWSETSDALHRGGHATRHVQRHSMAGFSYVAQVGGTIDESQAVIVAVSSSEDAGKKAKAFVDSARAVK